MRLIEVADLEKFIRKNVCAIGDDHLLLVAGNDGRWHEALPLIKTAYDVDKVVEELESFSKLAEDRWTNGTSKYAYQEHKCWVKAIEIVKQSSMGKDVE